MSLYIHITEREDTPPATGSKIFRVPRDIERMNYNTGDWRVRTDGTRGPVRTTVIEKGKAQPEVYRVYPLHHVILDFSFQKLWRELNPMLSDDKWSTLLGNELFLTNNTGFPGHYNCITGEYKGSPFPRFDQPRLCSNAIVTGIESDGELWLDTMLTANPGKKAFEVMKIKHYWFYGTSVNTRGETNYITRLGVDGQRHKVIIPVVTSQRVHIPLNELIAL